MFSFTFLPVGVSELCSLLLLNIFLLKSHIFPTWTVFRFFCFVFVCALGSACVAFTPVLSVLFEEDEDDTFAVVFVSSDDTAEQCQKYYQKKHADWFLVPFQDKDQRQDLKKKYGVFAGKEQVLFPGTTRKSGIPTLVVVDRKGTCLHLLDCDNPKVHDEIAMKGTSFLDQWKDCKWE